MDWKKYYEDTQEFIKKCEEVAKTLHIKYGRGYRADWVERWEITENTVCAYEDEHAIYFEFDAELLGLSSDELEKHIDDMIEKERLEKEEEARMRKETADKRKKELLKLSKEELVERVMHPFGRV